MRLDLAKQAFNQDELGHFLKPSAGILRMSPAKNSSLTDGVTSDRHPGVGVGRGRGYRVSARMTAS